MLDEPTAGLDPLMEGVFTEQVRAFREQGGSVLLSSHILAEVERLCDRVSIIREGRRVEHGTLAELRHLTRTSVSAELAVPAPGLTDIAGVHDLVVTDNRVTLNVDSAELDAVLGVLHTAGVRSLTATPRRWRSCSCATTAIRSRHDHAGLAMTGANPLLRFFGRRDRWWFVWWPIGVALLYVSQGWSVDRLYTSQADFDRAAASMAGNPALLAMTGPARALNTTGGQVFWQAAAYGAICVGLMSMFLIGRHTRAEEETGRDELLRAAPVGRFAPTGSAIIVVASANLLVGLVTTGSLIGYGLAVADSLAAGLGLTALGWLFTGTALVAAQLTASSRAMYGIAGAFIAVAYLLRAVGDVTGEFWSWLSPIGWYQAMMRSPVSDGGRCCCSWPVPESMSWWPFSCTSAATTVPACWRPGPDQLAHAAG